MTTTAPETEFVAEPGSHEARFSAVIEAPREAVYRCYVEPELLAQWWAPPGYTLEFDEFDPTPGGRWRILVTTSEGDEQAFRGVNHEISPNERIVQTFEWEGMPGHVCMQTAGFEDVDGGTRVSGQAVFQSVEDRDGMVESGMRKQTPIGLANLQTTAQSL